MAPSRSRNKALADSVESFFNRLRTDEYWPMLHNANGSIRIELTGGARAESYSVDLRGGYVSVSRRAASPDAIVRVDRELLGRFAEGRANVMSALLRGEVAIEGDLGLVTAFARLFPGPAASQWTYEERQAARQVGGRPA